MAEFSWFPGYGPNFMVHRHHIAFISLVHHITAVWLSTIFFYSYIAITSSHRSWHHKFSVLEKRRLGGGLVFVLRHQLYKCGTGVKVGNRHKNQSRGKGVWVFCSLRNAFAKCFKWWRASATIQLSSHAAFVFLHLWNAELIVRGYSDTLSLSLFNL